jgi:hypothetical protein
MKARYAKLLLPLAAAGAISVPAVAQASHSSDDPPQHFSHEHRRGDDRRSDHRRFEHPRFDDRRFERHRRGDDGRRNDSRGTDDGPNHR